MIEPESIAKNLDNRDGAKIVAFREIGLPVFRLNSLVTLQEEGTLGAIEEFALRSIAQDIDTIAEIEAFLGLPTKIVTRQVGQLLYDGTVETIRSEPPRYQLTQSGRLRLEQSSASRIIKEQIPIYIDGISRRVVAALPQDLWSNAQLDNLQIGVIAPTPRTPPRPSEIDLAQVNRMFALIADGGRPIRRAVRLDAVLGRVNVVFRRAIALAFKSDDGRQVTIAFAIDGRESDEHEIEYARSADATRTRLFGTLFDSEVRRKEIHKAYREIRENVPQVAQLSERGKSGRVVLGLKHKADKSPPVAKNVTLLSVYDHPPLLRRALETAIDRLLIISPWIRANVVTAEFREKLIACLQRNVKVTIAYGIGRVDARERPPDANAREALAAIAKRFPNFTFVRRRSTHAKILLMDNAFFVATSFNWLSFRGDPKEPMREEEGTLVDDPAIVDAYYNRLVDRINAEQTS